jgi:phosphomannomutase
MSRSAAAVDRIIKAYDVRGLVGTEIDEQFVADVGGAFARLVRDGDQPGAKQVAIGYDMRSSSPSLAAAFADGVVAQGLDVIRIGLASTDQLYFASGVLDCPGAMFTRGVANALTLMSACATAVPACESSKNANARRTRIIGFCLIRSCRRR